MENKKLISTRLTPHTLTKIDAFVKNRHYWRRNTVISNVLDTVFECFDEKAIYDMVRRHHHFNPGAHGTFSLEKACSD